MNKMEPQKELHAGRSGESSAVREKEMMGERGGNREKETLLVVSGSHPS